jgi:hypothetical protein
VNLFYECVVKLCYSDANASNLYSIGGFGNNRLGPECIEHNGHCTSDSLLGVTGAVLGVTPDPVA